jgi:hypothetical protein
MRRALLLSTASLLVMSANPVRAADAAPADDVHATQSTDIIIIGIAKLCSRAHRC